MNISFKKIYYFESKKEKSWVLPIICSKCGNDNDGIFREEENIEILKILGLIGNGYY